MSDEQKTVVCNTATNIRVLEMQECARCGCQRYTKDMTGGICDAVALCDVLKISRERDERKDTK